jgi:hypothetical protein
MVLSTMVASPHESDKLLQCMRGQQLFDSLGAYEKLELPAEFVETIGIRKLKGRGILSKDVERSLKLADQAREKEARRMKPRMTVEELREEAANTQVHNDNEWVPWEEQERRRLLDELVVKAYWNRQSREVLKGYKRIFPFVGVAERSTKSAIVTVIGLHLKAVKEIAKAEEPSTELKDADLSDLSYYDRLAFFIDLKEAKELVEDVQTGATKVFQASVRGLMSANGTTVDPHYFKEAGITPGTVPINHELLLEFLEDDLDPLDDDL